MRAELPGSARPIEVLLEEEAPDRVRIRLGKDAIGPDSFVARLHLPAAGSALEPGAALFRIALKTKVCEGDLCTYTDSEIDVAAPSQLVIEEVNPRLEADPLLLQEDPQEAGWIAVARVPTSHQREG